MSDVNERRDPGQVCVGGVGHRIASNAAFLWTPERENDRYVIRFSRGNVIVMMSSKSEEVVKRCAKYIAESIAGVPDPD
jgi:hypothetical protein